MKTKKNLLAIIGVVLVLAITVSATLAYLQDASGPVRNEFSKNEVTVALAETTGTNYNIIPGTSQSKDPKVSGTATLPAYVFVKVKDETNGLVTYAIDSEWTALPGVPNVYYREADGSGSYGDWSVLDGDTVSYAVSITNEQIEAVSGAVALTFDAYAIQKEGFSGPDAAWSAIISLPVASMSMTQLNVSSLGTMSDYISGGWTGELDTAVDFVTSDSAADIADKAYKDYPVDFVLSFNREITDGTKVHLFGQYDGFGAYWLGDDINQVGYTTLTANTGIKVVDSMLRAMGYTNTTIPYSEVVSVHDFKCGIAVEAGALGTGVALDGLTATLQLVMYDGSGQANVISTYTYTY